MLLFKKTDGNRKQLSNGGIWISNKQNNGKFDYYFVIELMVWKDVVGEKESPDKYNVSLLVVAPSQLSQEEIEDARRECGLDQMPITDMGKAQMLHECGIYAPIYNKNGQNAAHLMRFTRNHAEKAVGDLDSYLSQPMNAIGSTGYDFLRMDYMAGLNRGNLSPEAQLVKEISNL